LTTIYPVSPASTSFEANSDAAKMRGGITEVAEHRIAVAPLTGPPAPRGAVGFG